MINYDISIHTTVQPVFVRKKIGQDLKLGEAKPTIVNQQCPVYKFKCNLCEVGYVGFTRRHLHQCVDKHRNSSSSIRKHFRDKHSLAPNDLTKNFSVLITEVHQQIRLPHLRNVLYSRTETYSQGAIALYSCELRFLVRFSFFIFFII